MRVVGLFPYIKRARVADVTLELIAVLESAGYEVLLEEEKALELGRKDLGYPLQELLDRIEVGIALGGDGTLLRAARLLRQRQTPIFGVNLGHMGFLTEIDDHDIKEAVRRLQAGEFYLEDRIMVEARVWRGGKAGEPLVGLNDIVIGKGASPRMLRMEIRIDGHLTAGFAADGLIVTTPTGSTAYSLSAGGPVLEPRLQVLMITPICAHSVFARPLVVGRDAKIEISFTSLPSEAMITADGQEGIRLQEGDVISCYTAPQPTRLVRFQERSFYDLLRERFRDV
ncbi:MAG: NAD(+)/NADH kinase [Firmicutes bacterium]|jgi:NAD+ kinase|nr:NAD(+)/NADH kinase [Bacillota bacterium]